MCTIQRPEDKTMIYWNNPMDKKRILLIGLFLLSVVLIGFALWRLFFATKEPSPSVVRRPEREDEIPGAFPSADTGAPAIPGTPSAPGTLPSIPSVLPPTTQPGAAITPTKTISVPVAHVDTDHQNGLVFYNKQDGKFYRLNADGSVTALADTVFYNVESATLSPTKDEAIIEYPDGANIYYDFTTKKQVTLPKHWEDFSFAPNGDQIAAKSLSLSPENRWLIAADPTGASIELIEPLGDNADLVSVNWSPNNQIVAFSKTGNPIGGDRQEILLVGKKGENFPALVVEGRGFEASWSPSGEKLLYSVYNGASNYQPTLWITSADPGSIGLDRTLLQLNTWPDKCAFATDQYLYCAVPTQLPNGAGLAPQIAENIPDVLVRIDLETGTKTPIPLSENHTINSLTVSKSGTTLFFTDSHQSGLFSVAL